MINNLYIFKNFLWITDNTITKNLDWRGRYVNMETKPDICGRTYTHTGAETETFKTSCFSPLLHDSKIILELLKNNKVWSSLLLNCAKKCPLWHEVYLWMTCKAASYSLLFFVQFSGRFIWNSWNHQCWKPMYPNTLSLSTLPTPIHPQWDLVLSGNDYFLERKVALQNNFGKEMVIW